MSYITIYAALSGIWADIDDAQFMEEINQRDESLRLTFSKMIDNRQEEAECFLKALANILEPNGYKVTNLDDDNAEVV